MTERRAVATDNHSDFDAADEKGPRNTGAFFIHLVFQTRVFPIPKHIHSKSIICRI